MILKYVRLLSYCISCLVKYFNREDQLYFREVKFEETVGRRLLPSNGEKIKRKIAEITEKFDRNKDVPNADEDIHEQKFLIAQEKIQFVYHKKNGFVTWSTRSFDKPDNADDKV